MSAPFIPDAYDDYYLNLDVGAAVDETAVGITMTPGATFQVIDNGAPEVAFPTAAYYQGLLRCAYRLATTHGIDPTGKIVEQTTADLTGATGWSAQSTLVDSPGEDDRDPIFFFDDSNVLHIGWHRFNAAGTVRQGYTRLYSGGVETNVGIFPLSADARDSIGRPEGYDGGDNVAAYGAPLLLATVKSMLVTLPQVGNRPRIRRWLCNGSSWLYEPYLFRWNDNVLVMVCRNSTNGTDHSFGYLTRSTDNGITWSNLLTFSFVLDAPMMLQHSSGRVFLAARRINGAARETIITWTNDEGLTWAPFVVVYTHVTSDSSYPSIVERPDTSLLVFHYEPRFIRATEVTIT